ncbi:conserved hypothetical protein [Perkinsus marinus ATCC 50983]|uniref:Sulfite exporter TauE/SafE n=1 Tax=Perkinsus marinus (strain ATCC 50983 / TXsc) TaxID=423536 RepID=C5LDG2_PERM5|nr:conserved hypothetical protein [Perkinsus marinus ATCC 50983]EER05294.1 conserved hypothetical protein [Perkinsus marinus ATCC 50983]|eukprot:XP_002773478.1 conserved hypothetical protein [Perkinsus marinus ATCC 50983]
MSAPAADLSYVVLAGLSAFGCAAVAVGGGIGGGALYMPAFVAVMGDAHWAVPLSKVAINGVAVSATIFNLRQRHPTYDQPLIDLDIGLLLEPLTLLGSMLGVYLNVAMTSVEIFSCLVLVLSITAALTFRKAIQRRRLEEDASVDDGLGGAEMGLLVSASARPSSGVDRSVVDKASRILREEASLQPMKAWALLVLWLANGALLYLAEGPAELLCGGTAQKVPLLSGYGIYGRRFMYSRYWDEAGLPPSPVVYNKVNTIVYPLLSCFAGVCAGCLGIGGGLIKVQCCSLGKLSSAGCQGPLLLQLGMVPQAATATSIWMILFTSSSSGAWAGSRILVRKIKESGRQSTVAFLMGEGDCFDSRINALYGGGICIRPYVCQGWRSEE